MKTIEYTNKAGIRVFLNPETKDIFLVETTDHYNLTSAYNRKVKSFKRAYEVIEKLEKIKDEDKTDIYGFVELLDRCNMGMRIYCAMD